jgi:hypothetical protein
MSRQFLSDDDILIISRPLGLAFGVGQSILLRRLHFWLTLNAKDPSKVETHYKDGRWWSWNTYQGWSDDLGSLYSPDSCRRFLAQLEAYGIVVSATYNRLPIDRTKWYSINYEAYDAFMEMWESTGRPNANASHKTEGAAIYQAFINEWMNRAFAPAASPDEPQEPPQEEPVEGENRTNPPTVYPTQMDGVSYTDGQGILHTSSVQDTQTITSNSSLTPSGSPASSPRPSARNLALRSFGGKEEVYTQDKKGREVPVNPEPESEMERLIYVPTGAKELTEAQHRKLDAPLTAIENGMMRNLGTPRELYEREETFRLWLNWCVAKVTEIHYPKPPSRDKIIDFLRRVDGPDGWMEFQKKNRRYISTDVETFVQTQPEQAKKYSAGYDPLADDMEDFQ